MGTSQISQGEKDKFYKFFQTKPWQKRKKNISNLERKGGVYWIFSLTFLNNKEEKFHFFLLLKKNFGKFSGKIRKLIFKQRQ